MFTLKFMSDRHGANTTVSAVRYDTRFMRDLDSSGHSSQCHITVYQRPTSDGDGVEFQVGGDHPLSFERVFIENMHGKTIDHIAFDRCSGGT